MLAQNENVGTPPEKRDMVEGCLSIGFCVRAGRKWCFPFFQWLSQISGGDLIVIKRQVQRIVKVQNDISSVIITQQTL